MNVKTFHPDPASHLPLGQRQQAGAVRVEIPIDGCAGVRDTTLIVLDADDSFDIVIENETGVRECIYSFVKEQ